MSIGIYLNDKIRELPSWARFYIQVGKLVSELPNDQPVLLALIVPVRNYVAPLVAAGHTLNRLSFPPSNRAIKEHFETLRRQSDNSASIFFYTGRSQIYDNYRVYRGRLDGCRDGMLNIRIQSDGTKLSLRPQKAISVVKVSEDTRPLPGSQKGHKINASISFLQALFPERRVHNLLAHSSLENLLIGSVKTLRSEIKETEFVAPDDSQGKLDDILRVKRYSGKYDNYRSQLFKRSGHEPPDTPRNRSPRLVLFDGSMGFRKWHSHFLSSHRLVIMERSNTEFEDARDQVNREAVRSRDDVEMTCLPSLPPGVELDGFYI